MSCISSLLYLIFSDLLQSRIVFCKPMLMISPAISSDAVQMFVLS